MLNHITIMGRLTRDPELRYTQSQTPVASFTLAVDRDFGGRDGKIGFDDRVVYDLHIVVAVRASDQHEERRDAQN